MRKRPRPPAGELLAGVVGRLERLEVLDALADPIRQRSVRPPRAG